MKATDSGVICAAALCVGLLLLTACTKSSEDIKASHESSAGGTATARVAAKAPIDNTDAELVAAVTDGDSSTPVAVAYRIATRPQLQQPVVVEVVITPDKSARVLTMHLSVRGGDGLELQSEPRLEISDAGASDAFRQSVSVVPQQTGVLQLHLTVLAESSNSSLARSYSIPLLVLP